jgi:hypothetical protein
VAPSRLPGLGAQGHHQHPHGREYQPGTGVGLAAVPHGQVVVGEDVLDLLAGQRAVMIDGDVATLQEQSRILGQPALACAPGAERPQRGQVSVPGGR